LLANLADLARGLFDALPLVRTVAVGPLDVIISASLLAVVTIGSLDWKTLRTRPLLSWCPSAATRVLGLFVLIYCSFLVGLRSHAAFEGIQVRLLFPALVPAVILAVTVGRLALRPDRRAAVAIVWVMVSAVTIFVDRSYDPRPGSINSRQVQDQPAIRLVQEHFESAPDRRHLIFADDIYLMHFATATPVYRLPPVEALSVLLATVRANSLASDLLFVIGPPGPRASLSDTEGKTYGRELDNIAVRVRQGDDYGVWWVSTVSRTTGR
jgi:hypothetical protein